MDQDLSHLPPRKQQELKEIVRLIRDHAEVELIVLYGSYARGDWKEAKDLDPSRWSGHASDREPRTKPDTTAQGPGVSTARRGRRRVVAPQ